MTTPESTYWETRTASTRALLRLAHPVARLELEGRDDLRLAERLLHLRVLDHQHRRRPVLPVGALAAREGDDAVPALEAAGEQRLHEVVDAVALGHVQRVGNQRHLRVRVQGGIDGLLLELRYVALAEGVAARRQLHGRVVVGEERDV